MPIVATSFSDVPERWREAADDRAGRLVVPLETDFDATKEGGLAVVALPAGWGRNSDR